MSLLLLRNPPSGGGSGRYPTSKGALLLLMRSSITGPSSAAGVYTGLLLGFMHTPAPTAGGRNVPQGFGLAVLLSASGGSARTLTAAGQLVKVAFGGGNSAVILANGQTGVVVK